MQSPCCCSISRLVSPRAAKWRGGAAASLLPRRNATKLTVNALLRAATHLCLTPIHHLSSFALVPREDGRLLLAVRAPRKCTRPGDKTAGEGGGPAAAGAAGLGCVGYVCNWRTQKFPPTCRRVNGLLCVLGEAEEWSFGSPPPAAEITAVLHRSLAAFPRFGYITFSVHLLEIATELD